MKLIICDDDTRFMVSLRDQLSNLCEVYGFPCEIAAYHDPKRMLEKEQAERSKLFFLDIDMPGFSGFQVAERLQEQYADVALVFISGRDNLVFNAFDYHPYCFFRKATVMQELPQKFLRLWQHVAPKPVGLTLPADEENGATELSLVHYGEMRRNYLYLHMANSLRRIRMPIAKATQEWKGLGFVRTHSSYLVNAQYIHGFCSNGVTLRDGRVLPISRGRQKEVCTQLTQIIVNRSEAPFGKGQTIYGKENLSI